MARTVASVFLVALLLPLPALIAAAPPAATQPADGAGKTAAVTALQKKLGDVKLSSTALEDAIDYIRETTGANIHVNWRALELLNVTRQTQISVKLNDVSMRRALKAILDETGAGQQITYYIDEGVIEITTREIADQQLITRVYPVGDLVMEIPNFAGPSFNIQNQAQISGGGGGGGGSSQSILSGSGNGTSRAEQALSKDQRAQDLVRTIQETVHPEIWRENGGTASIRYFNGHLIVTAPRSVQEAISGKP